MQPINVYKSLIVGLNTVSHTADRISSIVTLTGCIVHCFVVDIIAERGDGILP